MSAGPCSAAIQVRNSSEFNSRYLRRIGHFTRNQGFQDGRRGAWNLPGRAPGTYKPFQLRMSPRWASYLLASRMQKRILIAAAGTVVGGLILAGILRLNGLFAKVVSGVWSGVSWLWGMLQSSHSMPGWVILVLGLLALFGLTIIGLLLKELLHGKKETAGPTFQKYTEDMLDAVRWRWRWVDNRITNLSCFCPICDAQLVPERDFTGTRFICERCPADGTGFPHVSRGRVVTEVMGDVQYAVAAAEREIHRRIRTGQ